jgi:GntR family transcriptional regulator/MocR family aminotransferase
MKPTPLVVLDRADSAPIQRQIYRRLRAAIAERRLSPGERLPSTRTLASQLGVARGTVDATYALLAGEGYVVGRGPAGTIVSPGLPAEIAQADARQPARVAAPDAASPAPVPFRMGLPALDAFPRALWMRLAARRVRSLGLIGMDYPDAAGLPELRQAIAAYLAISRGVVCTPDQVIVTSGYQGALGLAAKLLLRPGDPVWLEDPGYFMARRALDIAGARIVPVPVDAEGVDVAAGIARAGNARMAVVTPSHQAPMGVALSLPRRLTLLAWAADAGAWIVEDDYDGEFRYAGHPLPALKSLDRRDRVLYAGSFSKVLFPGLRLGYLVVPPAEAARFATACKTLNAGGLSLEQSVVADFMTQGHFGRHLKRMRGLYAARRAALADALLKRFGRRIELTVQAGGMHLLVRFPDEPDDADLARRAQAQGLGPTALSALSIEAGSARGLLLGFSNIPEPQAARMVARLEKALGERSRA